jgi:hypothetical protein
MKSRLPWMLFGTAFSVTLALIVGQRLSAEAMAVVIGVIAGVAASIPTSLIVVWFMGRNTVSHAVVDVAAAPARPAEPAEPRIVVMPAPQPAYSGFPAYGPHSYAGYAQAPAGPAYAAMPALRARRFTVIGGGEGAVEEPAYLEEAMPWQR